MRKIHGGGDLPLIECVDVRRGTWAVRCDKQDDGENGYSYAEVFVSHKPSLSEIKEIVIGYYNEQIDRRIVEGFSWNGKSVWLSTENQFNYKAAADLAVQTGGQTLPVTFKFGSGETADYYEFTTVDELMDFYAHAMAYVSRVLAEGWQEKDGIDWSAYQEEEGEV